jgi:hypothetical protein
MILCSSSNIGLGFEDPITLIIFVFFASRGYVAFLPTIMASHILENFLISICSSNIIRKRIMKILVFIIFELPLISSKQGDRITIMVI